MVAHVSTSHPLLSLSYNVRCTGAVASSVPLHADNRSRRLEEVDARAASEYHIPGLVTAGIPKSRRKQVSNPRGSCVAPCVVVTIVSPKSKGRAPGQSSFGGAGAVGAGDIVGCGSMVVGNPVGTGEVSIMVGVPVMSTVSIIVGVPVMSTMDVDVGDDVSGTTVGDCVIVIGADVVVSTVGAVVGGEVDGGADGADGASVKLTVASKVGISVTGLSVEAVVGALVVAAFVGASVAAAVGASVGSLVDGSSATGDDSFVGDGAKVGESET